MSKSEPKKCYCVCHNPASSAFNCEHCTEDLDPEIRELVNKNFKKLIWKDDKHLKDLRYKISKISLTPINDIYFVPPGVDGSVSLSEDRLDKIMAEVDDHTAVQAEEHYKKGFIDGQSSLLRSGQSVPNLFTEDEVQALMLAARIDELVDTYNKNFIHWGDDLEKAKFDVQSRLAELQRLKATTPTKHTESQGGSDG